MKSEEDIRFDLALILTEPERTVIYEHGIYSAYKKEIKHKKYNLAESFMCGVEACKHKYIVRIDGDDLVTSNMMSEGIGYGLQILERFPQFGAVFPFYKIINPDKTEIIIPFPQGAGVIYGRRAFEKVGGYDRRIYYQCDLDFYIRFTNYYPFIHCPYTYSWVNNGKNRSLNKRLMDRERKKVLQKHYGDNWEQADKALPKFGLCYYVN